MSSTTRFVCIHGHFYQPPRENPWLEQIEYQESAHPFHDWNERINIECYLPNAKARRLDSEGRLLKVINNYEYLSFDFGPTLLSWLERYGRSTYDAVLSADAASTTRCAGHGNAIAQAYNHIIMPLASKRDKITQIIWGIRDFRARFRRDPEGLWLPETAVDGETLEILVDNGIKFTILAPGQAAGYREAGKEWVSTASGAIDPSRAYRCNLRGNRSIALFFYDGPISQSIAFEGLLHNGEEFRTRLMSAFSPARTWPQLAHIATDGESYGHHHRFGEMALAYVLESFRKDPEIALTNYGEFLAENPPLVEAEVVQRSAWSCAHGVGRWSEDCGCAIAPGSGGNQKWRRPLRDALNLLRDRAGAVYEKVGAALIKDLDPARNDYIDVVLQREENTSEFIDRHAARPTTPEDRQLILKLMEMQRNGMLMFTSCGWFFDDIAGLEALQILRYAARTLQLARPYDDTLEEAFLAELARAVTNAKPVLSGAELFRDRIAPGIVNEARIVAHMAVIATFEDVGYQETFFCYDVTALDSVKERATGKTMVIGRSRVTSRITGESKELCFVAVHHGGVDLRCSVREGVSEEEYQRIKPELLGTFRTHSSTKLIRKLDFYFPGAYYTIGDLFIEQRRAILTAATGRMYEEQAAILENFYYGNKDLGLIIRRHEADLPDTFLAAARFVLNRTLLSELEKLSQGFFPDELQSTIEEARFWHITLDTAAAAKLTSGCILTLVNKLAQVPANGAGSLDILRFIDLGRNLDLNLELSEAQIRFFEIMQNFKDRREPIPPAFNELAYGLKVLPT